MQAPLPHSFCNYLGSNQVKKKKIETITFQHEACLNFTAFQSQDTGSFLKHGTLFSWGQALLKIALSPR